MKVNLSSVLNGINKFALALTIAAKAGLEVLALYKG